MQFFPLGKCQYYLYDAGYQKKKLHKNNFITALKSLPCYDESSYHLKFTGILISHPHSDHYRGLKYLLKSKEYHIAPTELLVNTQFNPSVLLSHTQCEKLNINLPHSSSAGNSYVCYAISSKWHT